MSDRIIVLNRGDSYIFNLTIHTDTGDIYVPTSEDIVYFGLMDPHQPFEDALVKKRYTKADFDTTTWTAEIKIVPQDTIDLFPGIYYYAVKLHHISTLENIDEVVTVVDKTKFIIND